MLTMYRMARGAAYTHLLEEGARFAREHAGRGEVLVIANTAGAADDFLRLYCGDTAGAHRFTLPRLTAALAAASAAERGLAPLNRFGAEALAARAAHDAERRGMLKYFRPIAGSPGFARALARTIEQLRLEDTPRQALIGSGPSGADLAGLLDSYESLLQEGRLADFALLLGMAAEAAEKGEHRLAALPVLLLDVPVRSSLAARFLCGLIRRSPAALVALASADEESARRLERILTFESAIVPDGSKGALSRLRRYLFDSKLNEREPADESLDFFSAAGEGLECIEIARRIQERAAAGVPFDRMAILLRAPERYQPLIEEALGRAGIPFHFTHGSVRPDPAGRAFLALLNCAGENLPATRFAEYLSLGETPRTDTKAMAAGAAFFAAEDDLLFRRETPAEVSEAEDQASPATPAGWEQLIVDAAVVGGRARWERRLRGLENELQLRVDAMEDDDEARRRHLLRQLEELRNLEQIALPVIERLDELPKSATWREWLEQLSALAEMTLRQPDSVLLALNELWAMGDVGPVTLEEVILVLTDRLRFLRRPPARRRYGRVWVAAIEEARGQYFEVVFLPGLAEGVFPKKAFEDPLLLDEYRARISDGLPRRNDRVVEERLRLHVAAAAAGRLVVSYPRIDSRQNRQRVPSFYAMEVARAAEGALPELKQFERRAAAGSLTRLGWPAPANPLNAVDALEYDLASLQAALSMPKGEARGAGRYLFSLNAHLGRSLRARHRRWERKWSSDDGLMHRDEDTAALLNQERLNRRSWSASSLQHFAACPYRFLLHGIHRFRPREETVALEVMDPLTRGSLFHAVQFALFARAPAAAPAEWLMLIDNVLDEVAAREEERLAPAIPRIWKSEIEDVRADLKGWLRRMPRDGEGWTPIHCEYAFGLPDEEGRDPASSPEPARVLDGVLARGSIDWVERDQAGRLRITDHKTGRPPTSRPRHVGGGAILQPLLYALAAEDRLGQPVAAARLYFCTQRGVYEEVAVEVGEEGSRQLKQALNVIDESIAKAYLPAAPQKDGCKYCDYRIACGPREEERTLRKEPLVFLRDLRAMP